MSRHGDTWKDTSKLLQDITAEQEFPTVRAKGYRSVIFVLTLCVYDMKLSPSLVKLLPTSMYDDALTNTLAPEKAACWA